MAVAGLLYVIIFLSALGIFHQPVSGLDEGDSCTIRQTAKRGVCAVITKCPSAIADVRQNRLPTSCGSYRGRYEIVCCPNPQPEYERISAQHCREYASAVYELQTDSAGHTRNQSVCNIIASRYIVNGDEATRGEYPHMALLRYELETGMCAGSLISNNFVLTAGHCLRTSFGPPKQVILGMHAINDLQLQQSGQATNRAQSFGVADVILHPAFRKNLNYYNDIGLIRLDRSVSFNAFVRPACLTGLDIAPRQRTAVASGWGHTAADGHTSDRLMKVRLHLYSTADCNATYTRTFGLPRGILEETQICAGSRTDESDTCQGDSGGPLQIQHPDETLYCMYTLLGVTSLGKRCGQVDTPSVYTRVEGYLPWIVSVVWPAEK